MEPTGTQILMDQVLAILLPAIVTAVGLMVTLGLAKLKQYVQTKTDNAAVGFAMGRLEDIIETTIVEINQAVKQAGEDGKITVEEAARIKNIAVNKVFAQLPPDLAATLDQATGHLRSWVDSKIEQQVAYQKS